MMLSNFVFKFLIITEKMISNKTFKAPNFLAGTPTKSNSTATSTSPYRFVTQSNAPREPLKEKIENQHGLIDPHKAEKCCNISEFKSPTDKKLQQEKVCLQFRKVSPFRRNSPYSKKQSPADRNPRQSMSQSETLSVYNSSTSSKVSSSYVPKCNKCLKRKQSYLLKEENRQSKLCSNCALEAIKQGKVVQQVLNQNSQENSQCQDFQRRTSSPNCKQVKNKCISPDRQSKGLNSDLGSIRISTEKDSLAKLRSRLSSSRSMVEQCLGMGEKKAKEIRSSFARKRLEMKQHYEKLKQTIQTSIKEDLNWLKQQEALSLESISRLDQDIRANQARLAQLGQDIESGFKGKGIPKTEPSSSLNSHFELLAEIETHVLCSKGSLQDFLGSSHEKTADQHSQLTSCQIPESTDQGFSSEVQSKLQQLYDANIYMLSSAVQNAAKIYMSAPKDQDLSPPNPNLFSFQGAPCH